MTLADVAASTCLSTWVLAAIEQEAFERLPGGIYRRSFVKAYAEAVGLDGARWARRYAAAFEPPPALLEPDRPAPPAGAMAPVVRANWPMVAALGAAVVLSAIALHSIRRVPPAADDRPAAIEPAVLLEPVAEPEAAAGVAIDAVESAGLRVRIASSGPCWISAVADGSRVVHRLVGTGEEVAVDAEAAITLRVGDAGAVTYTVNGRPARRLGLPGEAVTVEITPATIDALLVRDTSSTL